MNWLERVYAWGVALDRRLRRVHRLPVPVVSVGNLSVGGRGKTPLVIFIVDRLKELGLNPVVLTRGYGRQSRQALCVETGTEKFANSRDMGDEPLEIFVRTRCPVLVASNRVQIALDFLAEHRSSSKLVFVLDDGFQHWSLARDLNIAIVAEEDFQDRLLPMGRLREGPDALKRADLILKSGVDIVKKSHWPKEPDPEALVHVLTTRAPDPHYRKFFEHRRNVVFVELSDHARGEDIFEALMDLPGGELAVGLKEAAKLFSIDQLSRFYINKEAWLPMSESEFHVTLIDLELEIRDDRLEAALRGISERGS